MSLLLDLQKEFHEYDHELIDRQIDKKLGSFDNPMYDDPTCYGITFVFSIDYEN